MKVSLKYGAVSLPAALSLTQSLSLASKPWLLAGDWFRLRFSDFQPGGLINETVLMHFVNRVETPTRKSGRLKEPIQKNDTCLFKMIHSTGEEK